MTVDFVPSICTGTRILECFTLKECTLDELIEDLTNPVGEISAGFDGITGFLTEVTLELNAADACIVAAITSAFAIAGEPLPPIPLSPSAPDFTGLTDELATMETEVTDALGYLKDTFTLEDDGTKVTRIISA